MIKLYFGSPGCGKTTWACKLALEGKKFYRHCVCNFEQTVDGVYTDNMKKLGHYVYPSNTLVLIDEAGIEYNNRNYKKFPEKLVSYFKKHRHFDNDIILFSQSWEDVDITIRRLVDELWYIQKIGPFSVARKVKKFVTVNETDYQIINGYKFESPIWSFLPRPFKRSTITLTYRPKYYQYFDSWSNDENLPVFDFSKGEVIDV